LPRNKNTDELNGTYKELKRQTQIPRRDGNEHVQRSLRQTSRRL